MFKNSHLILWGFQSLFSLLFTLLGLYFLAHAKQFLFWKEGVFLSSLIACLLTTNHFYFSNPILDLILLTRTKLIRGTLCWILFLTLGKPEMSWLPFAIYPLIAFASTEEILSLCSSLLTIIFLDCLPATEMLLNHPFGSFHSLIEALFALIFLGTFLHSLRKKRSLLHFLVLLFFAEALFGRCPILNLLFFLSYGLVLYIKDFFSTLSGKDPCYPLFIPLLLFLGGRLLGCSPFLNQALVISFVTTLAIITFLQTLTLLLHPKSPQ